MPDQHRSHRRSRRLEHSQVDDLVERYEAGETVLELGAAYGINRTTVLSHLSRRGIATRGNKRKMSDDDVARAAEMYETGLSQVAVAARFGVDDTTVHREFLKAGVPTRPRNGKSTRKGIRGLCVCDRSTSLSLLHKPRCWA